MPIIDPTTGKKTYQSGEALPPVGSYDYKSDQNINASAQPISVVSSANGSKIIDQHIADHTKDMQGLQTGQTPTVTTTDPKNTSTFQDNPYTQALRKNGALTQDEAVASGMDLTGYKLDPKSNLYIKNDVSPLTPEQQVEQNTKAEQDNINSTFDSLTSGMDASTQNLINSYKSLYDQRIADQKIINDSSIRNQNTVNLRTGISRYAPQQAGQVLTNVENQGLNRLKEISVEEGSKIAEAEQALQDKKYTVFIQKRNELSELGKEKISQVQRLQDKALEEQKYQRELIQKEKDNINSVVASAAKNGATSDELAKIGAAKNYSEAITLAGDRLQTATGDLGDYLQYKRDTVAKGLVPLDYTGYKDQQDAKKQKNEIAKVYATADAKSRADANSSASDKNQQKLEQQYRQVLSKEFSARTGALGVENAKVNQANHLNSLITQYYDPKTGNYNIPTSQYTEFAIGLANLISPTGTASEKTTQDIKSLTAKSDINGLYQYLTGQPSNGNTQSMIKNLIDSVDRQAETASRNGEAALQNMRDQAPTDLEQSRVDALNKSTEMVGYEGQDRISKSRVNEYVKANGNYIWGKDPVSGKDITVADAIAKMYEQPGATDKDIEDYLRAQGKIQ